MNTHGRRFPLVLLICLLATSVHAQAQQPEPQRLPSPKAAPKNIRFDQPFGTTITQGTKIVQDSKGYLWIGSFWGGLTRYDGYSTQRFVNDPDDPRSLSNNQIFALLDDPDGVLWVGTIGGLNRYDPETGTFQHILHDPADAGSLSNDEVFALMKDRDGLLWIGTSEGLNRYDPQTGANTRFKLDAGGPGSAATDLVGSLMQDRAGTIWVGSWGLHRYDPETGTFSAFLPDPAIPEPGADPQRSVNRIQSIHEDRRGRIWVGTEGGGLYRFDPEKGTFFNYRKEAFRRDEDQDDNLRTITEDTEGGLWLGTERGLIWFDPDSGDTTSFRNNTLDSYSLSGDNINTIGYKLSF
jgi:two-component system sensor histidine kinase ChiS